ncbi:MAG: hypothetical protein ACRD3W_21325 [Terriglobales bacterium]
MFEINATLLIFVVMFLLFMAALNVMVLKPIGFAIENRHKAIRSNIDAGSAARAEAAALVTEYEKRLHETILAGQAIKNEVESQAQSEREAKLKAVRDRGMALLQAEKGKITAERAVLIDLLAEEEQTLVTTIVKKLLGDTAGVYAGVDRITARRALEDVS